MQEKVLEKGKLDMLNYYFDSSACPYDCFSPLSAFSAASHGLSLLFPLSLIIFHPFCLSLINSPLTSHQCLFFHSSMSSVSVFFICFLSSHITFWCLTFPSSDDSVLVSFPFLFLCYIFCSSFYCFKLLVPFSSRAVVGLKAAQWH